MVGGSSSRDISPVILGFLAFFGGSIYGYNVSAGAFLDSVKSEFNLTDVGVEIVSVCATITDACSMVIAGSFFLDRIGRRNSLFVACCFNIVGSLVGVLSHTFAMVCFGRLIQGVGNGVAFLTTPMLVSECVATEKRGTFGAIVQLGVVGIFPLPLLIQELFGEWRLTLGFGGVFGCLAMCILCMILPCNSSSREEENHRQNMEDGYEIYMGDEDEGEDDVGEEEVQLEEQNLGEQPLLQNHTSNDENLYDQVVEQTDGFISFRVGTILALVLAIGNNSTNALIFYGPQIMEDIGFESNDSLKVSLFLALVNIPFMFIVFSMISSFSRRFLMLIGLGMIIFSYVALGILLYVIQAGSTFVTILIIFLFLLSQIGFQVGPGTLFVVILPELFNQENRAKGMSIGTATMSLTTIIQNGTMLSQFNAFGNGMTFLFQGFITIVCFVLLFLHLPESKSFQVVHI